jgi:hypothetical protein
MPRSLYPRERDPVPIVQVAGWASEPVWTGAENPAPTGIRSPDRPANSDIQYYVTEINLEAEDTAAFWCSISVNFLGYIA